jgi:CheY-like chemotaxis protein
MASSSNQAYTLRSTARLELELRLSSIFPAIFHPAALMKRSQLLCPFRRPGGTILVVEDEADVRSFTVDMLRELGYRVIEAPDGSTDLRLLGTHREINLLFTDVGLPGGMNGLHLAEEAQRRKASLKVLFMSGYARNAIVHHGRLDPGVELLLKPFTYQGLAAKIRGILDAQ